jgi:hypothetical protein
MRGRDPRGLFDAQVKPLWLQLVFQALALGHSIVSKLVFFGANMSLALIGVFR